MISSGSSLRKTRCFLASISVLLLLLTGVSGGQALISTVGVGSQPAGVAVNSTTNRIYVPNEQSNSVSVINGITNTVVATIGVGFKPRFAAVNPTTNRIYVTHYFPKTVLVIDGTTNSVVGTVPLAGNPTGIDVNSVTNRVYVASIADGSQGGTFAGISVVDGSTLGIIATVPLAGSPGNVAVNATTNQIFTTSAAPNFVYTINGATNTVSASYPMGSVDGIAVNANTGRVYVANPSGNTLTVIDGVSGTIITTIGVGAGPSGVDVNPTANRIYVANQSALSLSVVSGVSNGVVATVPTPAGYGGVNDGVAVNAATSRIYVTHQGANVVSVIEDAPDLQIGGAIAFFSDRDGNIEIYTVNPDGSSLARLTNNSAEDSQPYWSPDGTKIVFESSRDGNREVYVMNADGTGQTRLTNNPALDGGPIWSSDGTKIAFSSDRDGNREVYVMNTDGTGQTRLTNATGQDIPTSWSPDGTKIAFSSDRTGNAEVYVMNADGTGQNRLTNSPAVDQSPVWSPDGNKIVFFSNRDGNYEIYVMNANGTSQTRLTNNPATDVRPFWSPDGTKMVFYSERDGNGELYTMNADGTFVSRLTNNPALDHGCNWASFKVIGTAVVSVPMSRIMTIKNNGGGTLNVSNVAASDPAFSVVPTSFAVAPGSSQNLTLSYTSTAVGTQYATLTIISNDPDLVQLVVNGTGRGIPTLLPDTTAAYNQLVSVPVRVGNTTGAGVVSSEVELAFNGDLLTVFSTSASGTLLTSNWTVASQVAQGSGSPMDTLKIAMATGSDALSGSGGLIKVNFSTANIRHPAVSPLTMTYALFNAGIPGEVTNGSLKLVGNNGSIVSFPATIIPRWSVGLTVSDVDENRNPGVAEVLGVRVNNGSQIETLSVTETGLSTGVFSGSIGTVFSLGSSSGDGVVQAKAGDVLVFAFDDSLDSAGNTVVRRDTTRVIGGKDGRVRVTVVSQPGDTVRVRLTDGDLNVSPGVQEVTTVSGINVRTGESEVLTLTEKSASDSIFFGMVKTALGSTAGSNNDGVFKAQKGDTLAITYSDTLTGMGGYASVVDRDWVVNPFGDADGNGSVQAFDAARVLFHVLSPFLTGIDSLSANVDLLAPFGVISPFDASLVLQKRVGLIGRFPVQEDESDNHPQPETDVSTPKAVAEQRLLSVEIREGYWAVMVDEREGILSGDLEISGLAGEVQVSPELAGYLALGKQGEGYLRVVFAGAVPAKGPGELVRVYQGVGSDKPQLTRAVLNDGQIGVVLSGVAAAGVIPLQFALEGNWPNPFNPSTVIRYALPQEVGVQLAVYDVLGQKVRTLVEGVRPAGMHLVLWDGKDERGRSVSSGMYLYRLEAGSFSAVHKMTLVR